MSAHFQQMTGVDAYNTNKSVRGRAAHQTQLAVAPSITGGISLPLPFLIVAGRHVQASKRAALKFPAPFRWALASCGIRHPAV